MAVNNTHINRSNEYYSYSFLETAAIVSVSSTITALAIPCNAVVIFIIAQVPSMRTATNILLLNLCVADLLTVLHLPFITIDLYITGYWIFGSFMCPFVSFSKSVGTKASILILMSLSIERYMVICKPSSVSITTKTVNIACIVLWVVAMVSAFPYFIFKQTSSVDGYDMCTETWSLSSAILYTCLLFVLFYLIPLVVMIALYFKIAQKLWRSSKRTNSMRGFQQTSRETVSTSKSRLTKICVAIVLSFTVSWAPSHILSFLYFSAHTPDISYEIDMIAYPVVQGIALSNCALNPILYCFMSQNFRNAMTKEWKRLTTRHQRRHFDGLTGQHMRSRKTSTKAKASMIPPGILNMNTNRYSYESSTTLTVFESAL